MLIVHLNCFVWIDSSATAQKAWAEWSSYDMLERWGTHPFPAIYCKPFSTKCSKRSHYTTEVKIFAFITHLFEHWPHTPASKMHTVWQSQSCFACHHFQIIQQLQLADSSCHHSALCTLYRRSGCIKGTKIKVLIKKKMYIYIQAVYASLMIAHTNWK